MSGSACANGWALNTVTQWAAGSNPNCGCVGYELDYNNLNTAVNNLTGQYAAAFIITGASTKQCTAGMWITGAYFRGIYLDQYNSTITTGIQDLSTSTTAYQLGGTHTYGMDLTGAAINSGYALLLGNTHAIAAYNGAKSAFMTLLSTDSANHLNIGNGVSGIQLYATATPATDGGVALGASTLAFANIYSKNALTVTSQRSKKTDIVPLREKGPEDGTPIDGSGRRFLALLDSTHAYSYRFKVGGMEGYETEEEQDVPVTEWIDETYWDMEDRDGVKTRIAKVRQVERQVYDEHQVHDENGQPVHDVVPGNEAQPAQGALEPIPVGIVSKR